MRNHRAGHTIITLTAFLVLQAGILPAQTDSEFDLTGGIGVRTFRNPEATYEPQQAQEPVALQSFRLFPEFTTGRFGIGLDITANYAFTGGPDGTAPEIRQEDWVPDENNSFAEIYIPKIRYMQWGERGASLYARLGRLDSASLGNGFIIGNYSNAQYLPDRPIAGFELDAGVQSAEFPYTAVEALVSNVAAFDILSARVSSRPLETTEIPALSDLELGLTFATDRVPEYYEQKGPENAVATDLEHDYDEAVLIGGLDIQQPLVTRESSSLSVVADFARQRGASGGALGVDGRVLGNFDYSLHLRAAAEGFIPGYFDEAYDLYRPQYYSVYSGASDVPASTGWMARGGVSLLSDTLSLTVSTEGSFGPPEPAETSTGSPHPAGLARNPRLSGTLSLEEGMIPGLTMDAKYETRNITEARDIVTAENTGFSARVNYRTGPAVISFSHTLRYDPYSTNDTNWRTTSGIESRIALY